MDLTTAHIGINCASIETSMKFYVDILECIPLLRTHSLKGMSMGYVQLPGGSILELIEDPSGKAREAAMTSNNHIAIRTNNVDEFAEKLVAAGIPIEVGPFRTDIVIDETFSDEATVYARVSESGTETAQRFLFFRGPDGERFEIMDDTVV